MRLKLSDMSPALRARVLATMLKVGTQYSPEELARKKFCCSPVADVERPAFAKVAGVRGPNKTEEEYNRRYLGGRGLYEAVTLKLPGGSRYTPDWMVIEPDGSVSLHEVKGSFRFGSQGRALTAFRECAACFHCFAFFWACRGKGMTGWSVVRQGVAAGKEGVS